MRLATALGSAIVTVPLAMLLADRAVADAAHAYLHGIRLFVWLTWIAEPAVPLAIASLLAAGIAALSGWRAGRKVRVILTAALATLVAAAITNALKLAFGRTWPETWVAGNPSWISDGVFGFFPFHGGAGWASFPSGHTTAITAPMLVLALRVPRFRLVAWIPVVLVAVGLLGADYHYVADVLAGAYIGAASAIGVAALVPATPPAAS